MDTDDLRLLAREIRIDIIKMLHKAGSGHTAGSLSTVEIFTALYFSILKHDPKNPNWEERDWLIVSNGHICPTQYTAMAHAGYFPLSWLGTYAKYNSKLQGHPERIRLPGIETTSGPLGSGLGQASGIAYCAKMDASADSARVKDARVYCLTSDGEHDEGNHWETVLFAGKYKLSNLTLIVDRNRIQIDGTTEEVMPLEPLKEKYQSFGWSVLEIDGHDIEEIIESLDYAKSITDRPTAIIAETIAGKGVSFMENDPAWHAKVPDKEEMEKALKELGS
jgi:transketolase